MTIGGLMLFEDEAFRVSFHVILVFTALTSAFVIFAVGAALRAFKAKVKVGAETLAGCRAEVRRALDPVGQIMMDGELWNAMNEDGSHLPPGTAVLVVKKDGRKLIVRKIS